MDPAGAIKGMVGGNKIYFGRYTGATPGRGRSPIGSQRAVARTRQQEGQLLRELHADYARLLRQVEDDPKLANLRFEFRDVDGPEMLMRWDMHAQTPLIFLINI